MTDPNYKDNLVRFFKSKGFKYKDIDAWMERNQIDKKINDAKAENYADLYYRAMASGNPITASAVLSQLAPINPQMASSIMATAPTWKEAWNVNNARENALTAYEMKQKADEANYKRQLARDRLQAEIKAWLNNQSSDLKTKQYLQQLEARRKIIAQLNGEDVANQWYNNAIQGISQGGKGSNKNGLTSEQEKWVNKLDELGELAFQAIGDINNIGETFTNPDDHRVEEYRQALMDFKASGIADKDAREIANQRLKELEDRYAEVQNVYRTS